MLDIILNLADKVFFFIAIFLDRLNNDINVFFLDSYINDERYIVMPDSCLSNRSDIFHYNNKNNQLER